MAHLSCFNVLSGASDNFNIIIKYRARWDDALFKNTLEVWLHAHINFLILTINPRPAVECLYKPNAPNNAPLHKFVIPPRA